MLGIIFCLSYKNLSVHAQWLSENLKSARFQIRKIWSYWYWDFISTRYKARKKKGRWSCPCLNWVEEEAFWSKWDKKKAFEREEEDWKDQPEGGGMNRRLAGEGRGKLFQIQKRRELRWPMKLDVRLHPASINAEVSGNCVPFNNADKTSPRLPKAPMFISLKFQFSICQIGIIIIHSYG